ncbi:LCP family protein required for cell wall assembly [Caldicoprobacter guelmensis]|uniref:LCP family protein n=1 Tax=Caldicoprobacter guelmensis TaxID=1170224 RepID=UPI001956B6ED|nr:LCP family protein [Caldicoprobacter guelmensis]MBM7583383.1 LCP family protein required for cell wall assembly [Caldicoprobacter guelmensis]
MRKFFIAALSILLVLLIASATYIYILLEQIEGNSLVDSSDSSNSSNSPNSPEKLTPEDLGISETAPKASETGVINILLFGLDTREKDQISRSDTIMIATIDKKNQVIKLTSLMRDMYLPIPGKSKNRINTAYIFGGPALAIKTVNTNFDLDIRYYVTVDFFGLEKIIDQVGGIPIDVKKQEIPYINSCIAELNSLNKNTKPVPMLTQPGLQTLNGRQAVAYARVRKVGNADFERTERQRRVLIELFKKAKNLSPLKLPGLISATLPYVETNLPKTEILSLGISVLGFKNKDILQYRIPADGTFKSQYIDGMAVLVPDLEKNKALLHDFIYGDGTNSQDIGNDYADIE